MRRLLRALLAVAALLPLALVSVSAQNVDELAAIADRSIWFLGPNTWCPYCKKLTPKWLEIQKQVEAERLHVQLFSMAKVDCTEVESKPMMMRGRQFIEFVSCSGWCVSLGVKGYPNVFLYHNGEISDEYLFQHEVPMILQYIKEKIAFYSNENQLPAAPLAQGDNLPGRAGEPLQENGESSDDELGVVAENEKVKEQQQKHEAKAVQQPEIRSKVKQLLQSTGTGAVSSGSKVDAQIAEKPSADAPAQASPSASESGDLQKPSQDSQAKVDDDILDSKPIKGVSKHPRKEFRGFRGFLQQNFVTPLVGPECSTSLLSFQFFAHFDCTRLLISKVLGIGLVAGGAVIKLPQIFKIFMKKSAQGVSFASYALETAAYIAGLAYNVRQENPFNTYGEHAFMAVANCIVIAMMFHYTSQHANLKIFVCLTALFTAGLFTRAVVSDTVLLSLQWLAIGVGVVSKLPQIYSNWTNQSCGQLSAVTVGLQTVGSLARCFTTATEVKDVVIFVTYLVATALNGTVLYQVVIYWGKKRKTKSLLD
ncbi:hypothetical protein HDU82_004265 [Entophlyctis luteolus]|nr:hypothetical protein HDU82_004265 [Entophlyctis luteolus]